MTKHLPSFESRDQMADASATGLAQAAAIGDQRDLCRGESDGHDDLFKLTLKALSKFYVELRVRPEGGKITPLTRVRAELKRIGRRLGWK